MDAPPTESGRSPETARYFLDTFEFLKEIAPDIDLNLFENLQSVTSPMLNALFDIGLQVYGAFRFGKLRPIKVLLSIYNFYLTMRETASWHRLIVGFFDLINSIFSFDGIPKILKLVQKTILKYFSSLRKYFLSPESAEKTVKNFWDMASFTDERSFLNIMWELCSVFGTIAYLRQLQNSCSLPHSIGEGLDIIQKHLLDPNNELRVRVKNSSMCIARVCDFFMLNLVHLVKGEFSEISWSLPHPMQFENQYADFMSTYRHYLENPLYLETVNQSVSQLLDKAKALIKKAHIEIAKSKQGAVKSAMTRYLKELGIVEIQLIEALNPNNMKPQPMALVIEGPAGCGKSSMVTNCGKIMQHTAGRRMDEDKIKNRGGDPKFEPGLTTDTDIIVHDDFANDIDRKIPSKEILDMINVTREVIPKASVEEKNRHRYSNVGAIFTTNDPNIGMNQIATISYDSILRRFGLVMSLSIKEKYRKEGTLMLDQFHPLLADGKQHPEIYDITLKRPIGINYTKGSVEVDYDIIEGWRIPGVCDCTAAFRFIKEDLAVTWKRNVHQHENRHSADRICQTCSLDHIACTCALEPILKPEGYSEIMSPVIQGFDRFHNGLSCISEQTTDYALLFDELVMLKFSNLSLSYSLIRANIGNTKDLFRGIHYLVENKYSFGVFSIFWLFIILFVEYGFFCFCIFLLFSTLSYLRIRQDRRLRLEEEHRIRCDFVRSHFYARMSVYGIVGGLSILLVFKLLTRCIDVFTHSKESKRDPAESLSPLTVGHDTFSKEKGLIEKDSWIDRYSPFSRRTTSTTRNRYLHKPELEESACTARRDEVVRYIGKRMLNVKIYTPNCDGPEEVKGIPLFGSCVGVPHHAIPRSGKFDIEICANASLRTSSYKTNSVPLSECTVLKDRYGKPMDYCLINVPNMPVLPDLSRFFALDSPPTQSPAQELVKKSDGTYEVIDVYIKPPGRLDVTTYKTIHGRMSDYPAYIAVSKDHKSQLGYCGSPVIMEGSNCIVGVHIAGSQMNRWCIAKITRDSLNEALTVLRAESKMFIAHPVPSEFVIKDNLSGLVFDDFVRDRATDALGESITPILEIGTISKGGERLVGRAQKHYFPNRNPRLVEAFGPRKYGPPKYPNGVPQINTTLKKLSQPKYGLPTDLIIRSMEDYLETPLGDVSFDSIIRELRDGDSKFGTVRSLDEAKRGDGTGIVQGMNNQSSAGTIYGGKKTRHINKEVDGDPYEVRELLPYIGKAIEEQEIEWRAGRGTFDFFTRHSKTNELLPNEKRELKTRCFYGNDMVFFLNSTRACIALKHILRKNMWLSECCVGITPQSSQWRTLRSFLMSHGKFSNFVCGDFSGFDTQLPKVILDAAAQILMTMAERSGYSKSDLEFLRGALSSIVSSTVLWDGHVLRMANGQPSGQPLTVEMNSIVNSLLMRMTFFTIMDRHYSHIKNPRFRDYVRLATYGDDNVLGVHDDIPLYNHTMIQSVFAEWGIKYTMADKDADSVPYLSIEEVSFLKRKFFEHEDLGLVAPIEKDSITKKFFYWVRPCNTPETFQEQFRGNVDAQTREACLHGRAYYESFCDSVRTVQEGSLEDTSEFHIKWNGFYLPSYEEMIEMLSPAYESVVR